MLITGVTWKIDIEALLHVQESGIAICKGAPMDLNENTKEIHHRIFRLRPLHAGPSGGVTKKNRKTSA
jgi:hypothetical protein